MISVAVDAPMAATLDYAWSGETLAHGTWVVAPLGRREVLGMVIHWERLGSARGMSVEVSATLPPEKIKALGKRLSVLPAADPKWIDLMAFAARYYRRPFGTIAVGLMPKWLRDTKNYIPKKEGGRSNVDRLVDGLLESVQTPTDQTSVETIGGHRPERGYDAIQDKTINASEPTLNSDQSSALAAIARPGVFVLHGVTGSGKTRVYTEAARRCTASDRQAQVLVMVPEIGLTPQLVGRFTQAIPGVEVAVLHSEVTERERARLWLSAASGRARLVIGTRLAIMTPMPHLSLIIVDEEHDHSYKQQEGMRYSARDLAVWRAQQLGITLVLGSATPSAETWAQVQRQKYSYLGLTHRATGEPAAIIELIDTLHDPAKEGLCEKSRRAIDQVLADSGQVLVFLNRRGYAPVLSCASCGWSSRCADCGVATVLHRPDRMADASSRSPLGQWRLQCHHCGIGSSVPRQCPDCGDSDLAPIGRGVQRLEDTLVATFPAARILRIDRDTVRQGKALAEEIEKIQRHEVDIVVGTQMLAKGHDFARMRLVVVADADTQLINPDFRAPERLFSTLIQVAGRAGRHEQSGVAARVLIQTRYPQHRLYRYLLNQDVAGYAHAELLDRESANLPPFSHMAAVRAAHRDEAKTRKLLRLLRDELQQFAAQHGWPVTAYGPVARYPEMQAGKWRGQIVLESSARPALHQLLAAAESWMAAHRELDCHVDVDPVEV